MKNDSAARRIVIVGGGAAGFFAAITCAEVAPDAEVIILEKSAQFLSKVKISGGEILRVEVERNFVTKSTAVWVGVGLTASLPSVSLGGGSLGDTGKSWAPPGLSAGASATAQSMIGVTFNGSGAVDDVAVKSTVQASGNVCTLSGSVGVSSGLSLENGPSLTPILNGSIGSKW